MVATLESPEVLQGIIPELPLDLQEDITNVCKMLADPHRLRIVFYLLREPELNVTELCERLAQSQPAVSHHLALLKSAQLLKVRRDGKHNFYSVCRPRFQQVMVRLFSSILENDGGSPRLDELLSGRFSGVD